MDPVHPLRHRQGGLIAFLLAIALCFSSAGAWAAGPKVFFDIPEGDAQDTLPKYSVQSKVGILYLVDTVRGARTKAVSGEFDATEALQQMLDGTNLAYSFQDDQSFVAIRPRPGEEQGAPSGSAEEPKFVNASTQLASRDQEDLKRLMPNEDDLAQVVITGSLIRGVLDIMSPLEFVTKKEMKKSSYATVYDALQALPVNFGGGPSEDFATMGNFADGSSVNLRGLGASSTLVLVNNGRQPFSGTEADFVDLSNIPWIAVDRIEVLPDGASALYGSDAIAGVVNVILHKDFDGAETQVRLGTAPGGGEEKLIGQLFGKRWDSGNVLLAYQFTDRSALPAAARAYTATADKRGLGGTDHRSYRSNPGNVLDPLTLVPALAIPSGQDGRDLTAAELLPSSINWQNQYAEIDLLSNRRAHSTFLSANQMFGERFELSAEARYNKRSGEQDYFAAEQLMLVPPTNAFSPYKGVRPVILGYSFLDDLGPAHLTSRVHMFSGGLGAKLRVGDSWNVKLKGDFGRETMDFASGNQVNQAALRAALADPNRETAFNPFGDGSSTNLATIDSIRGVQREYSRSSITAGNIIADGTAFELPTGSVKVAIGTEWRREQLARGARTRRSFDRDIESAYAELAIPIVGEPDDARAVPRLELSLAARYESYSDFGDSTNPKIGLRWAPLNSLKVRTSWGTSFKAPKLVDVYDSSNNAVSLVSLRDPSASAGSSLVLAIQGNNPNLKEEAASTWTAGFDLAPAMMRGLNFSFTYYSIDYDRRILVPGPLSPFDILLQEAQWSSVIQRNPQQAEINAACATSPLFGMTMAQCQNTPVAAIVDYRVRNMASTRVRGIDLKLDHSLRTNYGRFDFGLNGGYVLSFRQSTSDTSPATNVVDTVGNPLSLRLRGTAEWYQRDWDQSGLGVGVVVDRFGGYRDPSSEIASRVAPFTTYDFRFSYRTALGERTFDGIELALNAVNVFNSSPPFIDDDAGYDVVNADPYGRVVSVSVQKTW